MTTVQTVTGPIDSDELGFTLMHEHVMIANSSMRASFPDYVDVEVVKAKASERLAAAHALGVGCIVDLTPINLGRDVEVIRAVSERTGVPIVAATGFYYTEEPWMGFWPAEHLASYLVRDIEQGIQGTDARAGIIKCATDEAGVTPLNEKLLRTAAKAHRATGVPISTHTVPANRSGLAQQDVFEDEGVDLSRVVIGHCGDTEDVDYLEEVLRRGSTIGMDRFGIDMILPTKQRVNTIAELCRRGFASQMVLSHDACVHIDFFPPEVIATAAPNWNFSHVPGEVIPALRAEGVSDADIEQMTVANPARVFGAAGAY